jgi:hypothetical protein
MRICGIAKLTAKTFLTLKDKPNRVEKKNIPVGFVFRPLFKEVFLMKSKSNLWELLVSSAIKQQ